MKLFIFLLFDFLLAMLSPAKSQKGISDSIIVNSFNTYKSRCIQEKLFVHTDQDVYLTKQLMWFRIYYRDAFFNRPGNISQLAFLEILDKNNLPVAQQKVSLKPGESNGSLIIPVNLNTGYYRLRAYTSWMKNFDPELFFEKQILIINPGRLQKDSSIKTQNNFDIQFFPEGGNLVQNIRTKVAFRFTDIYGHGLNAKAYLTNTNGDTVLRFSPSHLGLGYFYITPAANARYTAHIITADGEVTRQLPAVYPDGYILNLTNIDSKELVINVSGSSDLEQKEVSLFIHGQYSSLPVEKSKIANGIARFKLNTDQLEVGISKFTLFDHNGVPVCERLFFKYPQKKISINPILNSTYQTRKKVDIDLSASDSISGMLNMSVAVYRMDNIQPIEQADISTYLNLTSEIGIIESPAYYFREYDSARQTDMDNLMLTHGWRRFKWKAMGEDKTFKPEFPPDYGVHIIRGKLLDDKNNNTIPGQRVYMSVPSTRTQFISELSDSLGRLRFDMKDFYGSKEIIVQAKEKTDQTHLHTEIETPFSVKYSKMSFPVNDIPKKSLPDLLDREIYNNSQHVYGEIMLNRFTEQPVDTNPFYVIPDEKYLLDDYTRFITMEEVLREYVKSLNVLGKGSRFELHLLDNNTGHFFAEIPLILIDGVPFFDANELFQQDPKNIKRLDLVNHEYVLGSEHFSGIINLTTYHGDLNGIQLNRHALVLDYPGIPYQREFFSPEYVTERQYVDRTPDFRSLLYWTPQVKKDDKGKYKLSFYTSDLPGNYILIMQGLTPNGDPISASKMFQVKK